MEFAKPLRSLFHLYHIFTLRIFMPSKQPHNACLGALLWLSGVKMAYALGTPHARRDLGSSKRSGLLLKRDAPSTTTYIAIIVSVVGTVTLVTIGICWDLRRRRKASKQRQMEEARHPRQPISYDHFPVEPGEASEHNEAGPTLGQQLNSTVMSAASASPITLPPGAHLASGPIRHFNPDQTHAPDYDTAVAPPIYMHGSETTGPPCPPGLESLHSSSEGTPVTGSHASSRHHVPLSPPSSRPPTASAPPAYSPSDPGSVHTRSAHALDQNSLEALPALPHSSPSSHSSHAAPVPSQQQQPHHS